MMLATIPEYFYKYFLTDLYPAIFRILKKNPADHPVRWFLQLLLFQDQSPPTSTIPSATGDWFNRTAP